MECHRYTATPQQCSTLTTVRNADMTSSQVAEYPILAVPEPSNRRAAANAATAHRVVREC